MEESSQEFQRTSANNQIDQPIDQPKEERIELKKRTKHEQEVIEYMRSENINERAARKLVARDLVIERTRKQRDEYRYRALHDHLTGLKRREIAIADIEEQIHLFKEGHLGAIIIGITDIDHFSKWNDLFSSHDLGDQCLVSFARILRQVMRKEDMVSRFGGEEFVIRLAVGQEITPEDARDLAKRIGVELSTEVMNNLLDKVLRDKILNGERRIPIEKCDSNGNRLYEREGTVLLRQYAKNLKAMRDQETVQEVVMKGKGSQSQEEKLELANMINSIDLSYYQEYLEDQRAIDEFGIKDGDTETDDAKALLRRREIERMMVDDIIRVFKQVTCSTGFIVLTEADRNDVRSAEQIKGIADSLMYLAKSSGRNRLVLQVGISNQEPEIIEIGKQKATSQQKNQTQKNQTNY